MATSLPLLNAFRYTQLEPLPAEYRGLSEEAYLARTADAKRALGERLVILGHHYQNWGVNRFADHLGDSYKLSAIAAKTRAEFIVFCGVTFMAETAAILARDDQKVLIPNQEAACPMAGMAEMVQVEGAWGAIEKACGAAPIPIAYMNSYADLKAFTGHHDGAVCTSSNAAAIMRWALDKGERALFLPDRYLGENTAIGLGLRDDEICVYNPWRPGGGVTPDELRRSRVILWDGFCQVHERFKLHHVEESRRRYPDALVIVHPECRPEVVEAADRCGSTEFIIEQVEKAPSGSKIVIGTEIHLVQRLAMEHPDKTIVQLCGEACLDCAAMRQIEPPYLLWCLEELLEGREVNRVVVDEATRRDALVALERMLTIR